MPGAVAKETAKSLFKAGAYSILSAIIGLHNEFNSTTIVFITFRNELARFGLLENYNYKNFSYYVIPDINFIKEIDLLRIHYLDIFFI